MKRFLCLGLLLMLVAGCTAQVDVSATSGGSTTAQKHATFIMNESVKEGAATIYLTYMCIDNMVYVITSNNAITPLVKMDNYHVSCDNFNKRDK